MHEWDVSASEAIAIQQRLRARVRRTNGFHLGALRTIAGVDASYTDKGRAAIVVFAFPELRVVDEAVATHAHVFPYVPGLLSFREGPAVVEAMGKLKAPPDLLMFDGQGYAHPRRFGLATHLGVFLDRPSIGCAKSRLIGRYAAPGPNMGDRTPLVDHGEVIGMALRTKPRTNPLFVSIGHEVDLATAVEVVLACLRGYRLPEPTREAHHLAERAKTFTEPERPTLWAT